MFINNPTKNIIYFNKKNKSIYFDLFENISARSVRNSSLMAHEKNISNFYLRPDRYNEVIPGITVIPPRTRWFFDGKNFHCQNANHLSLNFTIDFSEFIKNINRLTNVLTNKSVAIELSGGLDTSLIIGLLHNFGFDPFLIGVKSERYELRTELFIQYKYSKYFNDVCLIDEEHTLPFTKLKSTPLHQLPSSSSLYYMHAISIAKKCKEKNIDILFSGMGFDSLLCEKTYGLENNIIPYNWFNWMLEDYWFNQNVYTKHNILYTSGVSSNFIIKSIFALRNGQGEDVNKWWARNFFREYLPFELVNYPYKADNSGFFLDGLLKSKNEILEIFKVAYDVTSFEEFNKSGFNMIYDKIHLVSEKKDKLILSRISFANWVYGLVRDNVIN